MKKIIFRIFAVLLGSLAVILSLEVILRLSPTLGYNYNSFKIGPRKECMAWFLNNSPWHMGHYRPSAVLGYEHIPLSRPDINSYGLIGREYKLKKEKGVFRILILGDSIAEQGFAAEFLDSELNQRHPLNSKLKFEIWNSGTGGYDIRKYYLFLKHFGLNYQPDMVTIFLCINDFGLEVNVYYKNKDGVTEYYFPLYGLYKKGFVVSPFLMKHSYLYRFAALRLNSCLYYQKDPVGMDPEEENGRYYLGLINQLCRQNGISLSVVVFPYFKPLAKYKNWESTQYSTVRKVLDDSRIDYLDLYGLYERLMKENFPLALHENDYIHPSKEANKLIAQEIFNYFSTKKLVKQKNR